MDIVPSVKSSGGAGVVKISMPVKVFHTFKVPSTHPAAMVPPDRERDKDENSINNPVRVISEGLQSPQRYADAM
jgi:hypothetical protein